MDIKIPPNKWIGAVIISAFIIMVIVMLEALPPIPTEIFY